MSSESNNIDVLLNAYLDGELSPEQAEQVERMLAEDEALRRLLEQYRQVAGRVRDLPKQAAPGQLAEQISYELEREFLLGPESRWGQGSPEAVGRNHLRLRRFISAAAILILVSGMGLMVYTVFYPSSSPDSPVIAVKPLAEGSPPTNDTGIPDKPRAEESDTDRILAAVPTEITRRIRLQAQSLSPDNPAGNGQAIMAWLHDRGIEQIVQAPVDDERTHYAFLCSAGQLAELCDWLTADHGHRMDMLVSGSQVDQELTVHDVTADQVLYAAALTEPDRQWHYARDLAQSVDSAWVANAMPTERSIATDGSTGSPGADGSSSEWWMDWLNHQESLWSNLQVLGPEDTSPGSPANEDRLHDRYQGPPADHALVHSGVAEPNGPALPEPVNEYGTTQLPNTSDVTTPIAVTLIYVAYHEDALPDSPTTNVSDLPSPTADPNTF